MSFIRQVEQGRGFEAGYFMESEVGMVRKTRAIKQDGAETIGNEKYVLAGTLYNEDGVKGIVYEDVNVTSGDMPGSVVLAGRVYGDRIPAETKSGLEGVGGFTIIDSTPEVVRPYYNDEEA